MSFTERMALGRDLAQVRRDRGQHTGKSAKGWSCTRHAVNDNAWWIADQRKAWKQDCREILNDYRQTCLNRLGEDLGEFR